jgi:prepilin-type N-terminal cleavage/methylation domain-containing protein
MLRASKREYGFTLIELIMVIMILSVVAVISSKIITQGFAGYMTGTNIIQTDWQAKVALERMTRDLHDIPTYADIIAANTSASQISFTDFSDSTVTYKLSGTTLQLNGNTLASNIVSLTLTYLDKSGNALTAPPSSALAYIKIALVVSNNGTNYTYNTGVYMWGVS